MIALTAAQAISPAIERTKQFLFQPFRLGRFLKLALVALLAEGGMSSCNFNWHLPSGVPGGSEHPIHPIPPMHLPQTNWPTMMVVLAVVAIIALIVIPIMILIGYLLIRLRFSFFDCVLHRQDRIAPAWRRYHRQAMRYLGLTICTSLAFWIVIVGAGFAIYEHFKPLFQSIGSSHGPGLVDFLPVISIVLLLVLVLGLAGVFVHTALSYFVLPHMALEDASIRDALTDVWGDIEAEPWQYLFFLLLRFLLTLVASILGVIALVIPFAILAGIGAVIFVILKGLSAGAAVLLGIPAAILLGALFLLALIGVSGTIGTFRRNYALLFYGGRYPPLGAILAPSLPPPPPAWIPTPAPAAPGPVEGV